MRDSLGSFPPLTPPVETHMGDTQSTHESAVAAYDAAWQEANAPTRLQLLHQAFDAEAELISPGPSGRMVGVQAIAQHISQFFADNPGCRVTITTAVDQHHDWLRYAWTIHRQDGSLWLEGLDIGELSGNGR